MRPLRSSPDHFEILGPRHLPLVRLKGCPRGFIYRARLYPSRRSSLQRRRSLFCRQLRVRPLLQTQKMRSLIGVSRLSSWFRHVDSDITR
jgi:hypothetical protein